LLTLNIFCIRGHASGWNANVCFVRLNEPFHREVCMKKKAVKISTRVAIADTAVRLFSEHGYTGTTMRDIAEAVGVLPGSLYAHIDSKETLLLKIVSDGIAQFL